MGRPVERAEPTVQYAGHTVLSSQTVVRLSSWASASHSFSQMTFPYCWARRPPWMEVHYIPAPSYHLKVRIHGNVALRC